MKKIIFLLLLLASYSVAISNVDDDKRIKHELLKYNYGIIKMTKSGNTKLLKDMLPQKLYFKLMVWADSWKFSNLAMVAKINDLRFYPVKYNETNATIKTIENWTYGYADLVKKDYSLKPRNIFYRMNYTLKRDGDSWMIVDVDILKEEEFEHKNTSQKKETKPLDNTKSNM